MMSGEPSILFSRRTVVAARLSSLQQRVTREDAHVHLVEPHAFGWRESVFVLCSIAPADIERPQPITQHSVYNAASALS
jgi:hypothetical protein